MTRDLVSALLFCFALVSILCAESAWPGVDETVVEKYAEEAGRPPRDPYINTDQGDLLLFVFLTGGAVGGFVMGYYCQKLFGGGRTKEG